MYDSVVQSQDI